MKNVSRGNLDNLVVINKQAGLILIPVHHLDLVLCTKKRHREVLNERRKWVVNGQTKGISGK